MEEKSPFEITLQKEELNLNAFIKNISEREQVFLENRDFQHSNIVMVSDSGNEVEFFDARARTDSWNAMHGIIPKEDYVKLAPGEEKPLHESFFILEKDGKYSCQWGSYFAREIPTGKYSAYVEFESKLDWFSEEGKEKGKIQGVWKGKIKSNTIDFVL